MKAFDIEQALKGNPVCLRNGQKAFVGYKLNSKYNSSYPLRGHSEDFQMNTWICNERKWVSNGLCYDGNDYDIVGMWDESRIINGREVPRSATWDEPDDLGYAYFVNFGSTTLVSEFAYSKESEVGRNLVERVLVFKRRAHAEQMARALLNYTEAPYISMR